MDSAKNLALYERMARADLLGCAWEQVRRNKGAAGIDGETIGDVEAMGGDGDAGGAARAA